jgi:hypothetical protein
MLITELAKSKSKSGKELSVCNVAKGEKTKATKVYSHKEGGKEEDWFRQSKERSASSPKKMSASSPKKMSASSPKKRSASSPKKMSASSPKSKTLRKTGRKKVNVGGSCFVLSINGQV